MKRHLSSLLLLSLVANFAFQTPAFAQEEEKAVNVLTEATTTPEIQAEEVKDPQNSVKEKIALTELAQRIASASATTEDTANPNVPNTDPKTYLQSFQGKHEVSLFSGILNYYYPLWVPKGRLNMTPQIVATYSSIDNQYSSPLGFGWSLPINGIYRTPKKGVDTTYEENRFSADIFGKTEELIIIDATNGIYAPKNEGSFTQFSYNGTNWTAKDALGNTYTFGQNADSRQDDPNDSTKVFKWMLERVEDPNGNFMTFTYTKNGGAIYPDTIRYTGWDTEPGIFEIKFNLRDRDSYVSYHTDFRISYEKLIDSINLITYASGSAETFLTYNFNYTKQNNAIWLLDDITVTDGQESLPPTQFDYFAGSDSEVNKKINGLKKITTPYGGINTFTYKPSTAYREPNSTSSNMLPFVVHTVLTETAQASATDPTYTTTYDYRNGHYYVDDLDVFRREYAGFGNVTVTDPASNVRKLYFHQSQNDPNNNDDAILGEFEDHISKKGLIYRDEQYDNSGNIRKTAIQKWDKEDLPDDDPVESRQFSFLARKTVIDYGQNSQSKAAGTEYAYDDYGNPSEVIDYGEVTVNDTAGNFTDTGSDKITTDTSYAYNTTAHLLRFPSLEDRKNNSNTLISRHKTYYDDLSNGAINTGNVTRVEDFMNSTQSVATQTDYNAYGLPVNITNPRNYDTGITYDTHNLYPETITNAKTQETDYEYDPQFGVPLEITDPNGGIVQYVIDGFGRLEEQKVKAPDAQIKTLKELAYDFSSTPVSITQTTHADNNDNSSNPILLTQKTYFDGFGRPTQTKTEAKSSRNFVVTNTVYDERGNIKNEFLPKFTNTLNHEAINANDPKTAYTYDPLNRILTATNTLGTTTSVYDDWKTYVTDPDNKRKDYITDARGNLIQVKEYISSTPYTTTYTYNGLNNLTNITDASSNIRNITYDFLGRKLAQEDLHTSNDSTFGTWTYGYDADSNLTTQTDPKNQTINYTYDELDRPLTEDYTGQTGTEVTYTYDQGTNGIGRLTAVSTPAIQKSYSYDILGRTTQEQKTINSTTYTTTFGYDLLGNPLSIDYPGDTTVSYTYNNAAQLATVLKDSTTVISNLDYAPTGSPTQINFGNGVTTQNTYDPQQLFRLAHKLTTKDTTKLQDISYQFDPVGNITSLTDTSNTNNAKTASYGYDDLHRLTSATITNTANSQNYTHTYSYDILGNILTRSDVGTYVYAGGDPGTSNGTTTNPDAATTINSVTYTYDANGNVTSDGIWTYTYDYKDRIATTTNGTDTYNYFYDESGNRIKKVKVDPLTPKTTLYINKYYDIEDGNAKRYIYAGDLKVADDSGTNGLVYHSTDHLTGNNVDTDSSGNILEVLDYYPYGNVRLDEQTGTYQNDYKYTGKELDEGTNLYYYGARYYDAQIGRFMSLDPWGGDIKDPQSLNKYSYTLNNPLKYTDPSGKCVWDACAAETYGLFTVIGTMAAYLLTVATPNPTTPAYVTPETPQQPTTIVDPAPKPIGSPSPYTTPTLRPEEKIDSLTITPNWRKSTPNFTFIPDNNLFGNDNLIMNSDNVVPSGGIEIPTNKGIINIPGGYSIDPARNGKGTVYRPAGASGDENSIRSMDPTENYPNGYVRVYNENGQPINPDTGKPDTPDKTHIEKKK
jgi:RHS repeat-associated protein